MEGIRLDAAHDDHSRRRVRLPIGSGYRYHLVSGVVLAVLVSGMIAVGAAPAVPAFVALAGVLVAVAGIRTTGVFVTQTGELVEVSLRILGIRRWAHLTDEDRLTVHVIEVTPSALVRARLGGSQIAVVLEGGASQEASWSEELIPEYGHSLMRLPQDTDYAKSVADTIRRLRIS